MSPKKLLHTSKAVVAETLESVSPNVEESTIATDTEPLNPEESTASTPRHAERLEHEVSQENSLESGNDDSRDKKKTSCFL